ncbi:uncharacterized protein TNIN_323691 [Trichonephila inaurata madagascariensis]|uniref:Uncharacterized protein n=1 Tax=Trichonephila inaurata madagascariensis TaxID=2747483 RepID=A0A8X6JDG9_9ARAC|nr:uncharacterized protein TNIN_323691 [Trichonephila inaurata madagascariensis]
MANDHDSNMECTNVPLPTSRTSSPDLFTPCEQLIQVQNEIKKFTLLTLGAQQSLNSLAPFMTTDDPEVSELFQRLKFYEEELRRSECEYGTLSPCTTPGCAVHGTPPSTPSKSLKDYPALPKTNSNKRKESDDGFISPTRRQTIKKPNLITNSNFSLETDSISELSSDHNPVRFHFPRTSNFEMPPPQLNTTWSIFTNIFANPDNFELLTANSTQEIDSQVSNLTNEILNAPASVSKPFYHSEQPYAQRTQQS